MMKAVRAVKLGPRYRGHANSWYQQYEVTMADGRTRLAQVPVAYGRESAAVARQHAEAEVARLDAEP